MMADYAAILGFTPKMSNDEREAIIERGFARARSVVAKNAEEVARIAKVLMVWRSVDLSDVQPRVRAREIPISPRR
jgi:ATP-dependent Zn protease